MVLFAIITQRIMISNDSNVYDSVFSKFAIESDVNSLQGAKLAPRQRLSMSQSVHPDSNISYNNGDSNIIDFTEISEVDVDSIPIDQLNDLSVLLPDGETGELVGQTSHTQPVNTTYQSNGIIHSMEAHISPQILSHRTIFSDRNNSIAGGLDRPSNVDPSQGGSKQSSQTLEIVNNLLSSSTNRKNHPPQHIPLDNYYSNHTSHVSHRSVSQSNGVKHPAKKKQKLSRLHDPVRHNYHPNESPRKGTDISLPHQEALIRCHNQTRCVIPELQLKVKLKVYFCRKPVRSGARFYYLAHEGLLNHPNVELIDYANIDQADLIFYLPASAPWHLTECTNSSFAGKLVVLDEFDGHGMFLPYKTIEEAIAVYGQELNWYLMYFKRSFVSRLDGLFKHYPHLTRRNFYPLVYSLAEWYMSDTFHLQVSDM